jgi:hypothetical protein
MDHVPELSGSPGASPVRDGAFPPSSSQPPFFLAAQATASQSRTSSSSTLVPMQHIYPSLPNAGPSAGYRFPRTSSEPFLDDPPRAVSAGLPAAVFDGRGATPGDGRPSLGRPISSASSPGPSPERRPSLQDRRTNLLQNEGGPPQAVLTCSVDGGIGGLVPATTLDMRSLSLSTKADSPLAVETPSASKRSFLPANTDRNTPPARQGPGVGVVDRTPRLSTTIPAGLGLPTPSTSDSSSGHASHEGSGAVSGVDLASSARSDSWDSAAAEGGSSPWSRFQAQFQSARQPSTFSQSASAGSTYATTPDSEDPHHYSHLRPPSGLQHQQPSQHGQPSNPGSRTTSQMSLPLPGPFATDGLPVFSPSPYFKEIVSAHSIGDRSASAGPTALAHSPPHRLNTAELIAHYSSMSNQSPKTTQTEGFFDLASRARNQQAQPPPPPAHASTYSYRSPAGAGGAAVAKQRTSNVDATLGSSAFAPGLRARVVETLERVSARLDWKSGGGEGVVSIGLSNALALSDPTCFHIADNLANLAISCSSVEYSATQGASKELVCPIIARINARQAGSEAIQFSVYHQSPQEDLRQHTASLYAEGSYLSPAFLDGQHATLKDRVFSYSVAKAFGAVMAPPRTVHVGFSVLDLQWLYVMGVSWACLAERYHADILFSRTGTRRGRQG